MFINWPRLDELQSEIGQADFDEVVEIFLEEVAEAVDAIDPACRDLAAIEAQLHFVKSSALNLGFDHLAGICQRGEKLAANGHLPDTEMAAIPQALCDSLVEFRAQLSAQGDAA